MTIESSDILPLSREHEAASCVDLLLASEPWITLGLRREAALSTLMDPACEAHVVRDGQGVAGFVTLDMHGPLRGYVQILCVRPDCRGKGIGSALLRWSEERIFRESPNVFICVSSFNSGARRLYERLGFAHVATFTDMWVPGHDEPCCARPAGAGPHFVSGRRKIR